MPESNGRLAQCNFMRNAPKDMHRLTGAHAHAHAHSTGPHAFPFVSCPHRLTHAPEQPRT